MSRSLMSFIGGFAEGAGNILAEKAKQEREDDIRKQNLLDEIKLYSDKKEIDYNLDQKVRGQEEKDRIDYLISLGMTPEYIDHFAKYATKSDTALENWLSSNAKHYGLERWWNTDIVYGQYAGSNVMDMELSKVNKNNNAFDTKTTINNVKTENNITDNVAENQFSNVSTASGSTGSDKSAYTTSYIGSQLFFGKPSLKHDKHTTFIGSNGVRVDAFLTEQTPGKSDFGSSYLVSTADGHIPIGKYFQQYGDTVQYFDESTEKGKSLINQFYPNLEKSERTEYVVNYQNKPYIVTGRNDIYTNGTNEESITFMPNKLEELINFQLNLPGQPEGVPGANFMTEPMEGEVTYTKFKEYLTNNFPNASISNNYLQEGSGDITKAKQETGFVDRTLSVNDKGNIFKNFFATSTGFYAREELIESQTMPGQIEIDIVGGEPKDNYRAIVASSVYADLAQTWTNSRVSDGVNNYLQINANDPNVSFDAFASRAGAEIRNITNDVVAFYTSEIMNMPSDKFEEEYGNRMINQKPAVQNEEFAERVAYEELSKIRSFDDLLAIKDNINNTIESRLNAQTNNKIKDIGGMEVIDDLIKNIITDPNDLDQLGTLKAELNNLVDNMSITELIFKNHIDAKLDQMEPQNIGEELDQLLSEPEKSNFDKQKEKQLKDAGEESNEKLVWLNKGSVPIRTPDNRQEWNEKYGSTAETTVGGKGSLNDPNTGYLLFKSPDLPPNHVLPRPNVNPLFSVLTQENWDILYGDTHMPSGKPK